MREYVAWWRACSSRLASLALAAVVFGSLSAGLWQAQSHNDRLIREVRNSFQREERRREAQFPVLLNNIDERMNRHERAVERRREEDASVKNMVEELLELFGKEVKRTTHNTASRPAP